MKQAEFKNFLLLDRWKRLVDLVLILKADLETAITRELASRLTREPGSIMNPTALASINEALGGSVFNLRHRLSKDNNL